MEDLSLVNSRSEQVGAVGVSNDTTGSVIYDEVDSENVKEADAMEAAGSECDDQSVESSKMRINDIAASPGGAEDSSLAKAEQSCDAEAAANDCLNVEAHSKLLEEQGEMLEEGVDLTGKSMDSMPSHVSNSHTSTLPSVSDTLLSAFQFGNNPHTSVSLSQIFAAQDSSVTAASSNSYPNETVEKCDTADAGRTNSWSRHSRGRKRCYPLGKSLNHNGLKTNPLQDATGDSRNVRGRGHRGRPRGRGRGAGTSSTHSLLGNLPGATIFELP